MSVLPAKRKLELIVSLLLFRKIVRHFHGLRRQNLVGLNSVISLRASGILARNRCTAALNSLTQIPPRRAHKLNNCDCKVNVRRMANDGNVADCPASGCAPRIDVVTEQYTAAQRAPVGTNASVRSKPPVSHVSSGTIDNWMGDSSRYAQIQHSKGMPE